jgi:hypothetical protein
MLVETLEQQGDIEVITTARPAGNMRFVPGRHAAG